MLIDDCQVMLDSCAKFFRSLYIRGWFHSPTHSLERVEYVTATGEVPHHVARVREFHGGVAQLGDDKGFHVQVLHPEESGIEGSRLMFETMAGKRFEVSLQELVDERIAAFSTPALYRRFVADVRESASRPSILDIGGRDRSGLDRSKSFPWADVTVLDIVPGDNVTVVGDAHELTAHFPPDAFDGIYCVSVFEHLLMPWKVVLEMNRVLRVGGKCLIHTHQTLGMHDLPWDFWRYSDSSWDALFNHRTGFRVVERAMDSEQYVIPFLLRPEKITAEKSAGFEGSCVLVEKTGPTDLAWPVQVPEVIASAYPTHDDGQRGRSYVG